MDRAREKRWRTYKTWSFAAAFSAASRILSAESKKLLQTDKIAIWTALDLAADRLELQEKCVALKQEMQQQSVAAEQKMQEKCAAMEQELQQKCAVAEQKMQEKYAALEQELQQRNAVLAEELQSLQARYDRLLAAVRER